MTPNLEVNNCENFVNEKASSQWLGKKVVCGMVKKYQEHMDRCTDCHDMTEILLILVWYWWRIPRTHE